MYRPSAMVRNGVSRFAMTVSASTLNTRSGFLSFFSACTVKKSIRGRALVLRFAERSSNDTAGESGGRRNRGKGRRFALACRHEKCKKGEERLRRKELLKH